MCREANCAWCEHSQIRHATLHCGIDGTNLGASSKSLSDIASDCPHYEFDPAKYALRKA